MSRGEIGISRINQQKDHAAPLNEEGMMAALTAVEPTIGVLASEALQNGTLFFDCRLISLSPRYVSILGILYHPTGLSYKFSNWHLQPLSTTYIKALHLLFRAAGCFHIRCLTTISCP